MAAQQRNFLTEFFQGRFMAAVIGITSVILLLGIAIVLVKTMLWELWFPDYKRKAVTAQPIAKKKIRKNVAPQPKPSSEKERVTLGGRVMNKEPEFKEEEHKPGYDFQTKRKTSRTKVTPSGVEPEEKQKEPRPRLKEIPKQTPGALKLDPIDKGKKKKEKKTYPRHRRLTEKQLQKIRQLAKAAVVKIVAHNTDGSQTTGTGFFIDNRGTVVTTHQLIANARYLNVSKLAGLTVRGRKAIAYSREMNIAVVRTSFRSSLYFRCKLNPPKVGDSVYSITTSGRIRGGVVTKHFRDNEKEAGINGSALEITNRVFQTGAPVVNAWGNILGVGVGTEQSKSELNVCSTTENINNAFTLPKSSIAKRPKKKRRRKK